MKKKCPECGDKLIKDLYGYICDNNNCLYEIYDEPEQDPEFMVITSEDLISVDFEKFKKKYGKDSLDMVITSEDYMDEDYMDDD